MIACAKCIRQHLYTCVILKHSKAREIDAATCALAFLKTSFLTRAPMHVKACMNAYNIMKKTNGNASNARISENDDVKKHL